jgi:hypothetical protein
MIRTCLTGLGLAVLAFAAQAAQPATAPFVIGVASGGPTSHFLDVPVRVACPRGDLVQVVAVEVGHNASKIRAVDSEGVNIYQSGGGHWKGDHTQGAFLATTSPREPTNAGLRAGATITLTYSRYNVWKGAIAACVPGLETNTGSADNREGVSMGSGQGTRVSVDPSDRLSTRHEPLFVATILTGDASDRWFESSKYATLYTLQDGNTLILSYQIVPDREPTPYAATNSAPRVWSTGTRSYKTLSRF